MSRDLKFLLQIAAEDHASGKVSQVGKVAQRSAQQTAQQYKRTAQEGVKANESIQKSTVGTAQVSEQSAQRMTAIHRRMHQDRERLGIRSEERIRREILVTEQTYKRLVSTGKLSANEQARAYDSMRSKVSSLKKELEGAVFQQSRLGKGLDTGKNIAQGAMAMGAGITAAGYMLAQPVKRTMDYEQRLAYMANTAFAGEGLDAKIAGRETLRTAVNEAAKYGGSKDEAADALDAMISSGAISRDVAMQILPALHKAAIASNSSTVEMANIAVRGMQNFNISEKDIPLMLDIAAKAGEGGGFEIKDMARWLPELMAAAGTSGMSGIEDFKSIVTAAQTSLITGGSTDAAGNNLKNLLLKINSRDTAKAASKIEIAPGKSIDLAASLAEAKGNGVNSLDAFVGIVDKVVGKDKRYQELQSKIQQSKNKSPEQLQAMQQMSSLLQGSAIGQIIQDQQALLALVGYMNNREYASNIKTGLEKASGTNDENYKSVSNTAANKAEKFANAKDNAEYEAYKNLSDVVGDTALKLADYANHYPGLTAFVIGATDAIKTLAVAAGGAVVALGMLGGKGALKGLLNASTKAVGAKVAAHVGSKALQGSTSKGSVSLAKGLGKGLEKASPFLASGLVIADAATSAYSIANRDMGSDEKTQAYMEVAKDTAITGAGMWGGAKAGAALGSMAGPWGTVIGGAIGAAVGPAALEAVVDGIGSVLDSIGSFFSSDPKASENKSKEFAPKIDKDEATNYPTQDDILRVMEQYHQPQQLDPAIFQALEGSVLRAVEQARQTPQALNIHTTVDIQNGNIVAAVNALNHQEARRY